MALLFLTTVIDVPINARISENENTYAFVNIFRNSILPFVFIKSALSVVFWSRLVAFDITVRSN